MRPGAAVILASPARVSQAEAAAVHLLTKIEVAARFLA